MNKDKIKTYVKSLDIYPLIVELRNHNIIDDEWDWFNWEMAGNIIDTMAKHEYWCELHSPFSSNEKWFAGFTPHNTTGWNGVPDNYIGDQYGPVAIMRSALLTMLNQKQESDNNLLDLTWTPVDTNGSR